jgi:type VI secretion system protein ImpA
MPLPYALLTPISRNRPGGESLRYSAIYEKIKEARREEDDLPQGEWEHDRKTADWPLTIRLICQALSTKSKDLQLAVWLAEAMLRQEGVSGLCETLDLIRDLIEEFWDGLYPELEDNDTELRAVPLWWLGTSDTLLAAVMFLPVTRGGLNCLQYWESRWVGSAAAADTFEKQEQQRKMIVEGRLTEAQFENDFDATSGTFYASLKETLDRTLASLNQLSFVCDQRFGEVSPSFRQLRTALEHIRQTVHHLLLKKREKGPAEGQELVATAKPLDQIDVPQSSKDAIVRVVTGVEFLRRWDPYDPTPYLLLRTLRWGELRADGAFINPIHLIAPATEVRQSIWRAASEGSWRILLEEAESAMAMACGRGWLDLQSYVARACSKLGHLYEPIRIAVITALQALLREYPRLPALIMSDGRPTANQETLRWIQVEVIPYGTSEARTGDIGMPAETPAERPAPPPDAFDVAAQTVSYGSPQEGIEMLMRRAIEETSGRKRFERKVQVAQLCVGIGIEAVALQLLRAAAAEIELRKLEDWEPPEIVARPLAILYRCLANNGGTEEELLNLRDWIGRLNPLELPNLEQ